MYHTVYIFDMHEFNFSVEQVKWIQQQIIKSRKKRFVKLNDRKWSRMWYLVSI